MKWVTLDFNDGFQGELKAKRGSAKIGSEEGTLEPYDMMFGALGSCLYATFLEIAMKKRIGYHSVHIKVSGEKREETPTFLKTTHVELTVVNAEKEKGLEQAMTLATKYCSVYQTLAKVSEMTYELKFEYTEQEKA